MSKSRAHAIQSPRIGAIKLIGLLLVGFLLIPGTSTGAGGGGVGSGGGGSDGENSFPVRGKHTYGDGFGAGRGHRGQDLLADCRKKVVASQSGRVRVVDYEAGGAGNFVVISGSDTRLETVYMHMRKRLEVRKGERVRAGEPIGLVGSSGSSTACHLHFEIWSGPGWYKGGRAIDPTPRLRRWDRAN
ncbi:M23 family metallopeptidase [Thermoleophilia bacterium SCSIO 60948]|nr:M23 family metallopeptidase [Thermoleophilia bacterium SCSIO 60948]